MTMITPSYLGETIEYSSLHACRSTLEDPTLAAALPDTVIADVTKPVSAPGPEADQVVAVLERIKAGYVAASAPLENVRTRGRFSRVIKPWKPADGEQTEQSMPTPDWHPFFLVERGSKRRYELEYRILGAVPSTGKVNVVMNQDGIFKLDERQMFILNLKRSKSDWSDIAVGPYSETLAYDGRRYGPIDVVCDALIETARGRGDTDWTKSHWTLRCREEKGQILVEQLHYGELPEGRLRHTFSFAVDPKRGFRTTRFNRRWGGPGQNLDYEERREVQIDEILPGVFFQRRGRHFVRNLGKAPEKEATAGWALAQFVVDDIAVGDFDYDDKNFSVESLPIPKGADVEDRRVDPPLHLKFGEAPLNEQILQAAQRSRIDVPVSSGRHWPILLWANVAMFVVVAAVYVGRRLRHKA